MKVRSAFSNGVTLWGLLTLSVLAAIGMWRATGMGNAWVPAAWMLVTLSLLAECLPVEIERRSIHVTFSLPFTAGVALLVGPTAALIVAVSTALFAGVGLSLIRFGEGRRDLPGPKPPAYAAVLWNLSTIALSATAAGAATAWWTPPFPNSDIGAATYALAYTGAYGVTNFLVVLLFEVRVAQRRASDNVVSTLKLGGIGFVLYALVSVGVAVSLHEHAYWLVPGTAIPLLALRAALAFKAGAYAHYYETITALTLMMQRAHPYTHGHLQRVADYAEQVALRLGFSASHARLICEASVLHDLGKIAVDEAILDKPAKLTEDEMRHVRLHAELGAAILAPVKPFEAIVPWVRHHHERPDGRGYPDRMLDVEIPMESKIIAVADAFDAMTMDEHDGERRAYREPMTVEEALEELNRCSGSQFDPRIVAVFKEVVVAEGLV